MKRLAIILGGVVALAAFAAFVAPMLIPQSVLERQLAPLLADATGLELERAERLRLSIYPEPSIAFEGVSARLPIADGRAPRIQAQRIAAAFRTSALAEGRLELSRVTLEAPSSEIDLGAVQQGRAGDPAGLPWKAASGGAHAGAARLIRTANDEGRAVKLPAVEVSIVGGALTVRDEAGEAFALTNADLTVLSPGGSEPLQGGGAFQIRGEPVTVKATMSPVAQGFDTRFSLESTAGESHMEGTLAFEGEPGFTGAMRIVLNSGDALAAMFGGEPETLARFDGSEILARLTVSERRLEMRDGVITGPGLEAKLAALAEFDGGLRVSLQNLSLHGGKGEGLLTFTRENGGVLGASFTVKGTDALELGGGAAGFDWLSGRADIDIQLAAAGDTPAALIGTLKGNAKLSAADGAIEGVDLPEMVDRVKAGELDGFEREAGKRTPFDRMQATYAIENGVATTEDIRITGPNIEISGGGQTDFTKGRIKYKVNTRITSATTTAAVPAPAPSDTAGETAAPAEPDAFVMPLIVKGDWARPDIRPDLTGVMKDKEALRGTAKLFGKSVEKLTGGGVKADQFGKMIDGLLGKKKKPKDEAEEAGQGDTQN